MYYHGLRDCKTETVAQHCVNCKQANVNYTGKVIHCLLGTSWRFSETRG